MEIKHFKLRDLGVNLDWAKQHQILRRLQMQQMQAILTLGTENSTDYIKDSLIENKKFPILIKELLLNEIWRRTSLNIILKTLDFKPISNLPLDIVLENELTILALLETSFYHSDALETTEDYILDLINYCHRSLNCMLAIDKETENENLEINAKNLNLDFDSKKLLKSKISQDIYKISSMSLSIIFHVSNNFDSVPISSLNRILNVHNFPILITELLIRDTWTRIFTKNSQKQIKVFYDSNWHDHKNQRKVPKLNGMALALLFNLLAKQEAFEKYEMSSSNISGILKLRSIISPNYVLEQFGFLTTLKAQLDFLSIQGDSYITRHNNTENNKNKILLIETEPNLKQEILDQNKNITAITADQMRFWMQKTDFLTKFSLALDKAFNIDDLNVLNDQILQKEKQNFEKFENIPAAPPECNSCNKIAMNRCGRCALVWYCSRECQSKDWKKHKKTCKAVG